MTNLLTKFYGGLNLIMQNGIQSTVSIISFAFTDSDYDDVTTQTLTGSTVTSGLLYPFRGAKGSEEALLLEQGKLLQQDKILFLPGSPQINFSGNILIDVGGSKFTMVPAGLQSWQLSGSDIYHKIYLRHTIPGSLY